MRGEFMGVWSETWREIWEPLAAQDGAPDDIFCEIYRELAAVLKSKLKPEVLADVLDDSARGRDALQGTRDEDLSGERELTEFFERTHEALDELDGDRLSNAYFNLLGAFINKFSLRYDLRRPCSLCPTLPGMFASLVRDLRAVASQDAHLDGLMKEFDEAVRDLHTDCSDGRIKTCIQKQMNLLEAVGRRCPGVTGTTLGAICNEVGTWPHEYVKEAMKSLYRFTSDYPGIRHGGTPGSALRMIEMRDMVAMSILLVGFTPYLSDQLSAETVYRGG
jgi:hypothetical protein